MKELNTFRQFLTEEKEEKVSEDKIERAIKDTLKKEGGAAGIDPLKKAVKSLNVDTDFDIEKFLKKMSNVEKHKNGDYILTPLKENDEVLDEILNEAQEMDKAKSFLENKGLKVEAVKSGNEGNDKAGEEGKAFIWDGGEGEMNYKSNGKEAFYVYMPFNEEILKEMKSKFPVIKVGGKSGVYYEVVIEKK